MPYPFIQARNFTKATRRSIDLIVIHTMEAPEKPETAENVARWFAGRTAPRASAHYCVDADSVVQCVRDQDVAWHAPGANHNGIGIEHAGTARQTSADWSDDYSSRMLALSARLTAELCRKYAIPAVRLGPAQLRAGKRGVTGHIDCTRAFGVGSHWDPGPNFPWARFVDAVHDVLEGALPGVEPDVAEPPLLRRGLRGWEVRRLQKLLARAGMDPGSIDGMFGPATERALKEFQRTRELDVDGIAGTETWRELQSVYGGPR
jgi:N-acetyl-anhydromuramyl-L-alanine amidase AmpD